jgi:hypothetical protein
VPESRSAEHVSQAARVSQQKRARVREQRCHALNWLNFSVAVPLTGLLDKIRHLAASGCGIHCNRRQVSLCGCRASSRHGRMVRSTKRAAIGSSDTGQQCCRQPVHLHTDQQEIPERGDVRDVHSHKQVQSSTQEGRIEGATCS